ncbi:hypothetical protein BDZ89DRAFT_1023159 [Hymenopellis radicata]|nr:hypothetical protein BDZ89DRAFT_1023159 [Hymenopellis radicata]
MPPVVLLRRSDRIAGATDNTASAGTNTKKNAKAAPTKQRGRPASSTTDDDDQNDSRRKTRKRAMTNVTVESSDEPAPTRNQRGILKQVTETPLDVLLEIFSYLEPLDLLRMSRTTKALRGLLVSKSSSFVWERARLGMEGLPPMIEGFTEPQYANLLFDTHCHNCLKSPTKDVQWRIRMRLCKQCLEKSKIMLTEGELCKAFGQYSILSELLSITPCSIPQGRYHRDSYGMLLEEYRTLRIQRGTPADFAAWIFKKKQEYKALVQSCVEYNTWLTLRTEARTRELASIRHQRFECIIARLEAEGWEDELKLDSTRSGLRKQPLVNQSKELTDKTWEIVRRGVAEFMSQRRAEVLEEKKKQVIRQRICLLEELADSRLSESPESPPNPPGSAVCLYQPFFDIINDTPIEKDVTAKLKKALNLSLPDICEDWRQDQEERLKKILRKQGRNDDVSLAVNAFTCAQCSYSPPILHYPYFASHRCFYSRASFGLKTGEVSTEVWSAENVKALDLVDYRKCVKVIRMCGLDPDTATAEYMDAADVFFRCEKCDSIEALSALLMREGCDPPKRVFRKIRLMRWRTAMNHDFLEKVTRVKDAELIALGRAKEKSLLETGPTAGSSAPTFVCVHCNIEQPFDEHHLDSAHRIGG